MKPIVRARQAARCAFAHRAEVGAGHRDPCRCVGRSSPAIRFSSVDLPEPDGPISASNAPSAIVEIEVLEHLELLLAAPVTSCRRARAG